MTLYFKVGKSELKRMYYSFSRSASFVRVGCNGKTIYHSRVPFFQLGKKKQLHKPIELTVGEKEKIDIKITANALPKRFVSTGMDKFKIVVKSGNKLIAEGIV